MRNETLIGLYELLLLEREVRSRRVDAGPFLVPCHPVILAESVLHHDQGPQHREQGEPPVTPLCSGRPCQVPLGLGESSDVLEPRAPADSHLQTLECRPWEHEEAVRLDSHWNQGSCTHSWKEMTLQPLLELSHNRTQPVVKQVSLHKTTKGFLYFVLKPDSLKLPSKGSHSGKTPRDLISL